MFGLKKLKETLTGGASRLSGKTDLLEGIAAGGILVAAADGDLDTSEVAVLIDALVAHDVVGKAFSSTQIESTVQKMITAASPNAAGKIGMVGKMKLEKEVNEVKGKATQDDIIMMLAIITDVAGADEDGVEPSEKAVINKISNKLGVGDFL
jgi:tellurite resistance protein TerB